MSAPIDGTNTNVFWPEEGYYHQQTAVTAWRGSVHLSDAYASDVPYFTKQDAQRMLRRRCVEELQKVGFDQEQAREVRTQYSLYYTQYPTPLKGDAAVGNTVLTAVHKRRTQLSIEFKEFLASPVCPGSERIAPEILLEAAKCVVSALDEYDDFLSARDSYAAEIYRMALYAIKKPQLLTYQDLLSAAVSRLQYVPVEFYAPLVPPAFLRLMTDLYRLSQPFRERLVAEGAELDRLPVYAQWRDALMLHLVTRFSSVDVAGGGLEFDGDDVSPGANGNGLPVPSPQQQRDHLDNPNWGFDALNAQRVPTMASDADTLQKRLSDAGVNSQDQDIKKTLMDMLKACGDDDSTHLRSDQIEAMVRNTDDHSGPMEGEELTDHEVEFTTLSGERRSGSVREWAVPGVDDLSALPRFTREIAPVVAALRKLEVEVEAPLMVIQRRLTRGRLDRSRLVLEPLKDTLFKKTEIISQSKLNAPQCFVLALDGSGSMKKEELSFLGLLTGALISVAQYHAIQVLAAIYNSTGSMSQIRWVAHPEKSLAKSRSEALACVAESIWGSGGGQGGQADALALAHILNESNLSGTREQSTTLFHITDCGFIKSFKDAPGTAVDEIQEVLSRYCAEMSLHTVLLSTNPGSQAALANAYDEVIGFKKEQFDPAEAATRIVQHIATRLLKGA